MQSSTTIYWLVAANCHEAPAVHFSFSNFKMKKGTLTIPHQLSLFKTTELSQKYPTFRFSFCHPPNCFYCTSAREHLRWIPYTPFYPPPPNSVYIQYLQSLTRTSFLVFWWKRDCCLDWYPLAIGLFAAHDVNPRGYLNLCHAKRFTMRWLCNRVIDAERDWFSLRWRLWA